MSVTYCSMCGATFISSGPEQPHTCPGYRTEGDETASLRSEVSTLTAALKEARGECEEQARLNGMGSEREARLMARIKEVERERDAARDLLKKPVDDETIRLFGETPDTFTVGFVEGKIGGIYIHPATVRRMANMVKRSESALSEARGLLGEARKVVHAKRNPAGEPDADRLIYDIDSFLGGKEPPRE